MPSFTNYNPAEFVKLVLIGDSGCGKTGALTSLVTAGYKLRVIDLDNGLDSLYNLVMEECPDNANNVDFVQFSDDMKLDNMGRSVLKAVPRAFTRTCKAMDKWPSDDSKPAEWGNDHILVIDSLTSLARYAFFWAKAARPELAKRFDALVGIAQDCLYDLIYALTSTEFRTNLIVISHIDYRGGIHESDKEKKSLPEKGYIMSIGRALGPKIPIRFNTVLLSETRGSGTKLRRTIRTAPTPTIDLKNPAPQRLGTEPYPISTGLADIFRKLKNT